MSRRSVVHVVPSGNQWAVRSAGADRPASVHATQGAAIHAAREIARHARLGQVVIHRPDGTIREEHTYGLDPSRREG